MGQKESIYEVAPVKLSGKPSGKKRVASTNAATNEIISDSHFVVMDGMPNSPDVPKMVSLANPLVGLAILVWECGDDDIYRWKADINVTEDYLFRIERKMKDGSSRRTDVSIIF